MATKKAARSKLDTEAIHVLSVRAQEGDEQAMEQLKEHLPEHYDQYALEYYGDLAHTTEKALVRKVAGDQLLFREGVHQRADALRKELSGAYPSALEKLLIDRIICCWLMTNYSDAIYAQDLGERDWVQDEYIQKRQDRAQKRFLQACKALAQVRKLLGVQMQVNVAERQINIMGGDAHQTHPDMVEWVNTEDE